jgi:GTP cyclohydrolase II
MGQRAMAPKRDGGMQASAGAYRTGSHYPWNRENRALQVLVRVPLPMTRQGGQQQTTMAAFGPDMSQEHIAVIFGTLDEPAVAPLVRVHSECLTGDVFSSARCDCGPQLSEAVRTLQVHGGVLIYLRQEGRGIGLYRKLQAYALQDEGMDTYEANQALGFEPDARDFRDAARMLQALGVTSCRLITNNLDKVDQLIANGIEVVERVPTGVYVSASNYRYLKTKKQRARHEIDLPDAENLIPKEIP